MEIHRNPPHRIDSILPRHTYEAKFNRKIKLLSVGLHLPFRPSNRFALVGA